MESEFQFKPTKQVGEPAMKIKYYSVLRKVREKMQFFFCALDGKQFFTRKRPEFIRQNSHQ